MPRALILVTVLIASAVGFAPSAVARRAVVSTRLAAQNVNVNILPVRNSFSNFRGARAARSESRLPPPTARRPAGNFTVGNVAQMAADECELVMNESGEYDQAAPTAAATSALSFYRRRARAELLAREGGRRGRERARRGSRRMIRM